MNDISDEEEKKLDKQETLKERMRRKLYQIYFEIMKERNMSISFAAVLIVLSVLQLIGYIYYRKTDFPFNDSLYDSIGSFMDYIRIYPALESAQSTATYLAAIFIIVGFIFIYLLFLIFVDYSIGINKFYFNFPLKYSLIMSSILIWVLVCPITEVLASIFNCSNGYHAVMLTTQCWSGVHIFYVFLCAFCFILFLLIAIMIAQMFNESRSNCIDALGRLDTNMELYFLLYRVGIAIISIYGTNNVFQWILAAIHFIGSLNFVKLYFKYLPYYNHKISIIYGASICSYFWVSFNLVISLILESMNITGQSIVIIIGIAIVSLLVKNLRDKEICRILFESRHDKIKEDHDLDIYINKVLELMNDQDHNEVEEMTLLGFANNHKNECLNPDCPINSHEKLYLPATDSYALVNQSNLRDPIILRHLLNSIFCQYAKNSNSTAMLHIIYSHFLFTFIGNIHNALLELNAAEKTDASIQQNFSIYCFKRLIENYLIGRYKKKNKENSKQIFENLDVTLVITFENLYGKLQKSIEKSASEHIEFWSHLDSLLPDMNSLHKIGLNIITYSKETLDIWGKLTKINANYHKALRNYGYYLSEIRNDEEEGHEYIEKAKGLQASGSLEEHMNDFDIMFADDTAIVVMSGNKETQGKITKTNTGITNLFKYNAQEVTGHDVSILMPTLIATKHQLFLENFFKSGEEKVINKESELYAIPRSGFVISVSSIIKPVPSLREDIQYIGLIRERHKEFEYIITNEQGKIDCASSWISGLLHLQPNFLKENEVYIQLLCPDLMDIAIDSEGNACTKFDLLKGTPELDFLVPANFANIVQNFTKNPNMRRQQSISDSNDEKEIEDLKSATPQPDIANSSMKYISEELDNKLNEKGKVHRSKVPEIVKKLCYMIHGGSYSKKLRNVENVLKESICYTDFEFRRTWRVDVTERSFGNNLLRLKIFKILRDKGPEEITEKSSEKAYNVQRAPSHTRVTPEAKEHLKSIGLDPASTSQLSKFSKNEEKKNEPNTINEKETTPNKEDEKVNFQEIIIDLKNPPPKKETKTEDILDFEETKKTEQIYKPSEETDPNKLNMSLTSITNPNNLPSTIRDNTRVEPGSTPNETQANLTNLPNKTNGIDLPPNSVVNQSMTSDLNMSRLEERGLIIDVMDRGQNKDFIGAQDLKRNVIADAEPAWRDKFLRKGSKISPEDQEQVIRNYLKKEDEAKEEGKVGRAETNKPKEVKKEIKQNVDDDCGSVASNTKSLLKHLRALRKAVYEQYCPRSVTQLQYVARVVFLILLVITFVYFFIAKGLYENLNDNIDNVIYSKDRLCYTVGVGASVRALVLLNTFIQNTNTPLLDGRNATDYYKDGYNLGTSTSMTYTDWTITNLDQFAIDLKNAQNSLSTSSFSFSSQNIESINPSAIQIYYQNDTQIAGTFAVDCWSAIMGVVTHAFKVKDMTKSTITTSDPSVFYLLTNCFNSILAKIQMSTNAILDESDISATGNRKILLILLIVASISIAFSVAIILRVVVKVKQNKEDILVLFTEIPSKSVKTQLGKCRRCFNALHAEEKAELNDQNMDIEDDENKEDEKDANEEANKDGKIGKEEGDNEDEKKEEETEPLAEERARRNSRKNKKKFKPYSTNILLLFMKFIFFVAILEGYFILQYLESDNFLTKSLALINELGAITERSNSNSFLYWELQEYIGTNGTSTILSEQSGNYVTTQLNSTIQAQEDFITLHTNNMGYNDDSYNTFFDNMIYEDVCALLYKDPNSLSDCDSFQVLQKGLHSANVAFWDDIREFFNDFQALAKPTQSNIHSALSDPRLISDERLDSRYFTFAYLQLQNMLKTSLQNDFTTEYTLLLILFICYILLLLFIYLFVWTIFVESTRHSLWITKSMLAIIPVSTIQEVRSIKDFLISTSESLFIGLRSD